jgi:hypothetical protein
LDHLQKFLEWFASKSKEYQSAFTIVYTLLGVFAAWLLKLGNSRYKAGMDTNRAEASTRQMEKQGDKIEALEDRMSKVEAGFQTCRASRHELFVPLEKLINTKIESLEEKIYLLIANQRELAIEEKRREMSEIMQFIKAEIKKIGGPDNG